VVPDAFMGRFMALFRVVGTLSGFVFNTWIYGHAMTHTRIIYLGIAAIYFIGFIGMCLLVKEGDYPPPVHGKGLGLRGSIKVYFKECYSHRHYLYFNARNATWCLASLCGMYMVFFLRDHLNLSLGFLGKIGGYSGLISLVLLYPMGMLSDKFKAVRVTLVAMAMLLPFSLLSFFLLNDATMFVILSMASVPISTLVTASELPFYASLPPRERYGQFGSANQIVISICVIIGSVIAGKFLDWITANGTIVANYRYGYLWTFFFQSISLFFMYKLYRSWLRYGGPDHYIPPKV
jgi:predicted MFS family arabinose efflux permease